MAATSTMIIGHEGEDSLMMNPKGFKATVEGTEHMFIVSCGMHPDLRHRSWQLSSKAAFGKSWKGCKKRALDEKCLNCPYVFDVNNELPPGGID